MEQVASFLAIMNKAQKSVKLQLSQAYDSQVQLNTAALIVIIDNIQFVVSKGWFEGGNWDKSA